MMFECLENRRLFAVTANAFHETLYVWGDNNSNGISVSKEGSDLVVKQYVGGGHAGYAELFRASDSYVKTIRMYGYGGADTMTVHDNVTDRAYLMGGKGGDYLKGGGGQTELWGHGNWAGNPDHSPESDDGAADTTVSGKGYAIHKGQKGNDSLFTDTNAVSNYDMMDGGDGNDTFYVSGHGNHAYAFGGKGHDTFMPSQGATQKSSFYGGDGWDRADYKSWTSAVYIRPDGATYSGLRYGERRTLLQADVEFVEGTNQADFFYGSAADNTFYGHGGNDTMYGNGGNDLLSGGAGNDFISGGTGNDYIAGDAGADNIYGNDGNDTVYAGSGSDNVRGGNGNDKLYGQNDADWIYGDAGNDLLVGGHGADYLHSHDGVFGNDVVRGDNEDGTGSAGFLDVAYIDKSFWWMADFTSGVESVSS